MSHSKYQLVLCELYHDYIHHDLYGYSHPDLLGHYYVIDTFDSLTEKESVSSEFFSDDSHWDDVFPSNSSLLQLEDVDPDPDPADDDVNMNTTPALADDTEWFWNNALWDFTNVPIIEVAMIEHIHRYREYHDDPKFWNTPHGCIRNYHAIVQHPVYIQPQIAETFYFQNDEACEMLCVLKTYWLRLIQRTWKRIYREKQAALEKRKQVSSLQYREIFGKWPPGLNVLPSLYGMLHCAN